MVVLEELPPLEVPVAVWLPEELLEVLLESELEFELEPDAEELLPPLLEGADVIVDEPEPEAVDEAIFEAV